MRIWPLWFRILLIAALVFGVVLIADYAHGQELPATPSPQFKVLTRGFIVGEATMWAGVLGDGWASSHYINHSRCTGEGNPLFARSDGTFKTGKYFAVNLPIAAGITVIDVLVRRHTNDKYARATMTVIAAGSGLYHLREVARFKTSGWGC